MLIGGRNAVAERRAVVRVERDDVTLTDVLMDLLVAEVERLGIRETARRVLVDHSMIAKWLRGMTRPNGESIDALVAYFSWWRVYYHRTDMRLAYSGHPEALRFDDEGTLIEDVGGHSWT